jgi:hypothetical protein
MPKPNIGTRKPSARDDPGLPSGPSRRANAVTSATTVCTASAPSIVVRIRDGIAGPNRKYSCETVISSVRLRCTAL